jgi:CRP-like cAMP-binding protein
MTGTDATLADIALFAELSRQDLAAIETCCQWHRIGAEQQVFDRHSDSLEVYFIVAGAVRILSQACEREVALADLPAGRYFGELAAIDGLPRSARVVTLCDSLLASLDGPNFRQVLLRHPEVALRVMGRMTGVIRDLDQRVIELSTTSEAQRICGELLRLAEPMTGKPEVWCVADMPNHKEIAAWIGSSREVVAQVIGELARDGVVKRRGMGLTITDVQRLRLLARAA